MLDDDTKTEIKSYLDQRDEGFAAKQELAILQSVSAKVKEIEAEKRSRTQFFTALGGFSLISLALLVWGNISDLVQDRTEDVIKENLADLETIKLDIAEQRKLVDEQSRLVTSLRNNTEASLSDFKDTLKDVEETLGELRTAKGGAKLTETIVQFRNEMDRLEAVFLKGVAETEVTSGSTPPAPTGCINADGTFKTNPDGTFLPGC